MLSRQLKESRIAELANSASVADRFERACLLAELGRTLEARDAYIDVLSRDPSHRAALNNLGALLLQTGYRAAARTAFLEAVSRYPDDPVSQTNLANVYRESGDLANARAHYELAIDLDPNLAEAHQGLSVVLADLGDTTRAVHHRRLGFGGKPVITYPYRGDSQPVSVLVLAGTAGGNVTVRYFLDERVFETNIVFVEYFDPATPLPAHSVIFNAIGDVESEAAALAAAPRILALTNAPVVNSPAAVIETGRGHNADRLARIPGVITSGAVTLPRDQLASPEAATLLTRLGFEFPLLIRTPGFHMGRHFLRVESIADLPAALAELPGEELIVMRFLDARGPDGKARKYRIMMIDGRLYPLHVAVAGHWKVHYITADMADNAAHRAEDAAFLVDMEGVLGPRAMAALSAIQSALGLDYAGIDFALNAAGDLLLFETNATMSVYPPDADEKWAYRRPAVESIYAAARSMLLERSRPAVS